MIKQERFFQNKMSNFLSEQYYVAARILEHFLKTSKSLESDNYR